MTRLRPQIDIDLPLLTGGDSPFDDFGPRSPRTTPAPADLNSDGGLTVVTDDDQVAGDVGWHWQQWGPTVGSRCPMIGIWLRPGFRGRGIGTSAQIQLTELLFRHTTTHRVQAHTDVDNISEQSSLESAGFTREGVVRGGQWRAGAFRDGYLYSALRTDPRPPA